MTKNKRNGIRNIPEPLRFVSANPNSDLKNPANLARARDRRIVKDENLILKKNQPKKIKKDNLIYRDPRYQFIKQPNIVEKKLFALGKKFDIVNNIKKKPCELKKQLRRKILIIGRKSNKTGTRSAKREC